MSELYDNQGIALKDQPIREEEERRKRIRVADGSSAQLNAGYGVSKGRTWRISSNARAQSGTLQLSRRGGPGPSNESTRNDVSPLQPSILLPQVSHSQYKTTHSHPSRNSDEATGNAYPPIQLSNQGQRVYPDISSPEELEAMLGSIATPNQHTYAEEQNITTHHIHQPRSLRHGRVSRPNLPSNRRLPYPGDDQSSHASAGHCVPPIREQNRTPTIQTHAGYNDHDGKQFTKIASNQQVLSSRKHEQSTTRKRQAEREDQVSEHSSQMTGIESYQPGAEHQFVAKRRRAGNCNPICSQAPQAPDDITLSPKLEGHQPSTTHRVARCSPGAADDSFRVGCNKAIPSNGERKQLPIGRSTGGIHNLIPSTGDLLMTPSFIDDLRSNAPVQDDLSGQRMRAGDPGFDFDVVQDGHFARYSSPPRNVSRSSTLSVRSRSRTQDAGI